MALTTVIFDMDGLLIDSEPLWHEAAVEIMQEHKIVMSTEEYATSIGLRTKEFLVYWFNKYGIEHAHAEATEAAINKLVIEKVRLNGLALPGVKYIMDFFQKKGFHIGLATSSPFSLIHVVVNKLGLANYFSAMSSAEQLPYGKPHPQVYLDCASALGVDPSECLCFEDSFNGMIAVKASRMKCVVIPPAYQLNESRWNAADLKLTSLEEFDDSHLNLLSS
jgi:mannitol-1-/sugar-/sorbitol-6-/2-deoxyglucose-6-phosphatase